MVKNVEHGTMLGKCVVDGQPIFEGSGARSKNSTIVNGKWISGDTILKIYPVAFHAFLDENKDKEREIRQQAKEDIRSNLEGTLTILQLLVISLESII